MPNLVNIKQYFSLLSVWGTMVVDVLLIAETGEMIMSVLPYNSAIYKSYFLKKKKNCQKQLISATFGHFGVL